MKQLMILSLSLLLAVSTACKESGSTDAGNENGVTLDDVKKEFGEAADKGIEFLKQQKEKWAASTNEALDELDKKIDVLEAKAADAKEDVKANMKVQIEKLKKLKEEARKEFQEAKAKAPEAWEDVKGGVNKAVDELKKAYKDAKEEFEDKSGDEVPEEG